MYFPNYPWALGQVFATHCLGCFSAPALVLHTQPLLSQTKFRKYHFQLRNLQGLPLASGSPAAHQVSLEALHKKIQGLQLHQTN